MNSHPRQMLLQLTEWRPVGTGLKAAPVPLTRAPSRVWTLVVKGGETPKLPIEPQHGRNAFLEDVSHDWTFRRGQFQYNSRIGYGPSCWVLLEFAPPVRVEKLTDPEAQVGMPKTHRWAVYEGESYRDAYRTKGEATRAAARLEASR